MHIRNSDVEAKAALRHAAVQYAKGEGRIFVPYCGFGEVSACYPDEQIDGCDIDLSCVEWWAEQRPRANIVRADVDAAIDDLQGVYRVADFDAFGVPWRAVNHFAQTVKRAARFALVVTDATRERLIRERLPFDFERAAYDGKESRRAENQMASWAEEVERHLQAIFPGAVVVRSVLQKQYRKPDYHLAFVGEDAMGESERVRQAWAAEHSRDQEGAAMWMALLDEWNWEQSPAGVNGKLTRPRAELMCRSFALGMKVTMTAARAGILPTTFYRWMRAGEDAIDAGRETIEAAAYRAFACARAVGNERMLSCIQDAALTDWKAAAWYLDHVGRGRSDEADDRLTKPKPIPVAWRDLHGNVVRIDDRLPSPEPDVETD